MSPEERQTTLIQIAKFKAHLSNPWQPIKDAQSGIDPIVIHACRTGMQSIVDELEERIRADRAERDLTKMEAGK